jgi:hypothetical protein
MSGVSSAWKAIISLFIEDGWIATGTLLALVAVGLLEWGVSGSGALGDLGGPLLFVILMALLLLSVYTAGRKARADR